MAVPKGKISKARRDKRRNSHWKLSLPGMAKCPKCGEMKLAHRMCKACGYYNGREVKSVKDSFLQIFSGFDEKARRCIEKGRTEHGSDMSRAQIGASLRRTDLCSCIKSHIHAAAFYGFAKQIRLNAR